MLPPSRPHSSSQASDRGQPPPQYQQRPTYAFPPSPSYGQFNQPSSHPPQQRAYDPNPTSPMAMGMQDASSHGEESGWNNRWDGGAGERGQDSRTSSRPSTSSSNRPPHSLPSNSPPLQPQHRPPSTNSTTSHSSSRPFADPGTSHPHSQSSSISTTGTSRQTFYSSPSLTSRSVPNSANVGVESEAGGQRSAAGGGNEAALGYDSLLGAAPPPSSSSSSSNGTGEGNRSAQRGRDLFYGREGANSQGAAVRRDASPGERGMSRGEEESMSGLGVSGWSGESRSSSGEGEARVDDGGDRYASSRPESASRTTRTNDGLPDLPYQQQQSPNQARTAANGSYFPQSTLDRERTNSVSQGGANYGSGGTLSGHPSSSSLASSAGLFSPLSPLVEPFSPSTTASGGSAIWGVSSKGISIVRFRSHVGQTGATADALLLRRRTTRSTPQLHLSIFVDTLSKHSSNTNSSSSKASPLSLTAPPNPPSRQPSKPTPLSTASSPPSTSASVASQSTASSTRSAPPNPASPPSSTVPTFSSGAQASRRASRRTTPSSSEAGSSTAPTLATRATAG